MRIQGHDTARWLNAERLIAYPRFVLAAAIVLAVVWLVLGGGLTLPGGSPAGREFLSLWAAGVLALKGAAATAFDPGAIKAALSGIAGTGADAYSAWYNPPALMLFTAPMALVPFWAGITVWLLVSFGLYLLMVRALGREPAVIWPLAAFPAVYAGMAFGDTGLLATAILGGALLLSERRPLPAGILAGALVIKPFVLAATLLALVAGGRWRALGAMVLSAGALILATDRLLGSGIWQAYLAAGPMSGWAMEGTGVPLSHYTSLFAGLQGLGSGANVAIAVHGVVGLAAMASALWAWRQPLALEIRASILVCAMLLAHPFVRNHDLVLLAIPIGLFLVQGRRDGFHAWEGPVLVALWWLPAASLAAAYLNLSVAPPAVIILFLALILRRVAETAIYGPRLSAALGGRP